MERHYNMGELRKVVRESANEFKPVMGKNVPEDNKKINKEAYKDIEKETKDYDGGIVKKDGKGFSPSAEVNQGMSDLAYDSISKPFADKVKAQVKGFTSVENEKNNKDAEFGNATFGDDKEYVDHAKEAKKEKDESRVSAHKGKTPVGDSEKTIGESKKMKRLTFKRTEFLGEEHMLSMVPDEFKTSGNKFVMKDGKGNSYMVEWKENNKNTVTKMLNEEKVNAEMDRIKNLFGYVSKEYFSNTTAKSRLNEESKFPDMLNRARELMK